jgi:hypothetical protein
LENKYLSIGQVSAVLPWLFVVGVNGGDHAAARGAVAAAVGAAAGAGKPAGFF